MAYTAIDDPEAYFQTKIYTGNATDETAITLDGDTDMQPDLIWIKDRDAQQHNRLMDSVRGLKQILRSDSDDTDLSSFPYTAGSADGLHSIDSDGFTLTEDDSDYGFNGSGSKTVAWCWKAGGSASSNSDGDITSSVSANTTAGFSIMSYTGTGSNNTVGHGLNSAPTFTIIRRKDAARNWFVSAVPYTGDTGYLYLHTTTAGASSGESFFTAKPNATNLLLGDDADANVVSGSYIAYCFADVAGYSKCGKYTGNGNADGTFIYTGFKPAWVMVKITSGTDNWNIVDNKRATYNEAEYTMRANLSNAEYTGTAYGIDILSNGFKCRTDDGNFNGSGSTYVYMAFAEAPFVNSNGVPCNAR